MKIIKFLKLTATIPKPKRMYSINIDGTFTPARGYLWFCLTVRRQIVKAEAHQV